MPTRFAFAIATVLAMVTGATAAEPPKPAIVIQIKPVSRVLVEFKEIVRQVGGPAQGDRLVKEFEQALKDVLGEKGFEGLDINRPIAAYSILHEKPEDTGFVLVLPVINEKDFIGFLERLNMKAEPVKDKKGLYTLEAANGGIFPKGAHLQFTDGSWAHVILNTDDPIEPKNLVGVGDLLDNADTSLFSLKLYPGRVPEKLLATLLDELDTNANNIKMFAGAIIDKKHLARLATTFLESGPKLVRRYGETGVKEVTEVSLKFNFDQLSGDTFTELNLVPKPGTAFAKDVAAQQAKKTSVERVSKAPFEQVCLDFVKIIPRSVLKKAYLLAANELHPDKNGGDGSKMAALNNLWSRIEQEVK